eukprot:5613279-Pleurochrysis_carterae.AAC.1
MPSSYHRRDRTSLATVLGPADSTNLGAFARIFTTTATVADYHTLHVTVDTSGAACRRLTACASAISDHRPAHPRAATLFAHARTLLRRYSDMPRFTITLCLVWCIHSPVRTRSKIATLGHMPPDALLVVARLAPLPSPLLTLHHASRSAAATHHLSAPTLRTVASSSVE